MAVVGYATIQLIPSLRGFAGSTNSQMGPIVRSTGTQAGQQAGGLFGGSFLGAVGKIMAAAGIYELGSKVASTFTGAFATGIKGFADLQTYTISFETLLGSAKAADDMIKNLYKFAAVTPFDVSGSVIGAQKLLGVNVAAKDVIPTLTTLGDATAALGGSTNEFNAVLLAYSQIMARGKVSTQDLYQISNTGIPIFQLMSKALGKPVGEIQKLIETGNLASDDVLPKLLDQMNKEYGGAMAKQATTLTGLWSTFKDTLGQVLTQALTPLGEWLVQQLPGFTTTASNAIKWLQDKFGEFYSYITSPRAKLEDTFSGLAKGLQDTDWEGLLTTLGNAIAATWETVQPIVKAISDYIGSNLPETVKGATSLLQGLIDLLNSDGGQAALNAGILGDSLKDVGDKSESSSNKLLDFLGTVNDKAGTSWGMTTGSADFIGSLLQGQDAVSATKDALEGKFGPAMQYAAEQAQAKAVIFNVAFTSMKGIISSFGSNANIDLLGFALKGLGALGNFVDGAVLKIRVWVDQTLVTLGTGAVRFTTALAQGAVDMALAFGRGILTIPAKVASMIAQALAELTSGRDRFSSAGTALIGGFISGIESMIERAKAAAKRVVDAVSQFFPHSPAPEGPFSGRGWTLYSGRSLVGGFEDGIKQRQSSLRRTMADTFKTPGIGDMPAPASLRGALTTATQAQSNGNYIGTVNLPTTDGGTGVIDELNFLLRTLNRGGR